MADTGRTPEQEIRAALSLLLDVPGNSETHEAALNASAALDRLVRQPHHARFGVVRHALTEGQLRPAQLDERIVLGLVQFCQPLAPQNRKAQ